MIEPTNSPKTIIVAASDLVQWLKHELLHLVKEEANFKEIITQVVAALLNDEGNDELIKELPVFNRMTKEPQFDNPCATITIERAVQSFALALRVRLKQLGTYQGADFNYFFDSFLGDDLVVSHLPH